MKKLLDDLSKVDRVAAMFLWLEDVAMWDDEVEINGKKRPVRDHNSFEEALRYWKVLVNSVELSPLWRDGRHAGDCTKAPHTCSRCLMEDYQRYAKQWLAWFEDGVPLWREENGG